ncbi:MAG: hypothetical protein WD004_06720 [Actinomycetota bacterium]
MTGEEPHGDGSDRDASAEPEWEKFDVITSSKQFLLAEAEDSFGVWDRTDLEEPRGSFPASAEGFEAAEALFKRLNRERRRETGYWFRVLLRVFFTTFVLSVPILIVTGLFPLIGFTWVGSIEIVLLGSFLGALLVWLRDRPPGSGPIIAPVEGGMTLPRTLVLVGIGGLVVWAVSGVVQILLPVPEFGMFGGWEPTPSYMINVFVHSTAFLVWVVCVASLILIALFRTLAGQTQEETGVEAEEDADGPE